MDEGRTFSVPIPAETAPIITEDSGIVKRDIISTVKSDVSIVGYNQENGKPYTVDHFKLFNYTDFLKSPQLDIDNIVPNVDMLEKYVVDNIELRGLEDKKETYDFLIGEILEQIGDIEVEDIRHKFFRIMKYVNKNQDVARKTQLESIKEQLMELEYGR